VRAAVGAARLLPVPGVHPAVQLIAVEPDGPTRPRSLQPTCFDGPPERGLVHVAVRSRLPIVEVRTFRCSCFHRLSFLSPDGGCRALQFDSIVLLNYAHGTAKGGQNGTFDTVTEELNNVDSLKTFLALPVGALKGIEASIPFKWPRAETYPFDGEEIRAEGFNEWTLPLDDPDLFASLARLYEDGEPPNEKVRRWIEMHGLFTASNNEEGCLGNPLTLKEFRKEARDAHTALELFNALRLGNPTLIRGWLMKPRRPQTLDGDDKPKGPHPEGKFANVYLNTDAQDELDARYVVRVGDNLADRRVLLAGLGALQELVWPKIDLEVTFGMNFNHPRPLGGLFRPVPLLMPRDLLSAVWLQFCIDLADFDHEWRLCVACGRPFEVTRSDQTTCPSRPGCKKKRQRLQVAG
jgi:hypothetical protein